MGASSFASLPGCVSFSFRFYHRLRYFAMAPTHALFQTRGVDIQFPKTNQNKHMHCCTTCDLDPTCFGADLGVGWLNRRGIRALAIWAAWRSPFEALIVMLWLLSRGRAKDHRCWPWIDRPTGFARSNRLWQPTHW